MKLIVRIMYLSVIFLLLMTGVLELCGRSVRMAELEQAASTAMTQVMIYERENIEDDLYGTDLCRKKFVEDRDMVDDYLLCLGKLLNSDGSFYVDVMVADRDRGILSLEVVSEYPSFFGRMQRISVRKTGIVERRG